MSKERELLKKILATRWLDHALSCEVEKLLAQPEQTEQEPVAWKVVDKTTGDFMFSRVKPNARSYTYDEVIPLYASPPKHEPLSDETIAELWGDKYSGKTYMVKNFARAIEKAHSIGVGNEH